MPFNNDNADIIIEILWITTISFFASFAKELNDKAKSPCETFLLFVSEILLNGICGAIVGILSANLIDSIYTISAIAAIGGLLGLELVKYLVKLGIAYISAIKGIKINDINNIDIDNKENDKKIKK